MIANLARAERSAEDLLRSLNMNSAFHMPVDLDKVALSQGLLVVYDDFSRFNPEEVGFDDKADGFLYMPSRTVGINKKKAPARQRFTLAHEVGHYMLHRDSMEGEVYMRDEMSSKGTDAKEVEANRFAAALLMPRDLFERVFHALSVSDTAAFFGVSEQAVGVRAQTLFGARAASF